VIFQHFGSKAALFATVLRRAAADMSAHLAAAAVRAGSIRRMLEQFLDPAAVRALHEPGAVGALFADATVLVSDEELAEAARAAISEIVDGLVALLVEGRRTGQVRATSSLWRGLVVAVPPQRPTADWRSRQQRPRSRRGWQRSPYPSL
jgi:AcrR family transcriptional regulator